MRRVSQKGLAVEWLTERLEDGPVNSRTIREEGAKKGFSSTVLLRAAAELDLISTSIAGKYRRMTIWSFDEVQDYEDPGP